MTPDEFKRMAFAELANRDTHNLSRAIMNGEGPLAEGIAEIVRWTKTHEAFPTMSILDMWKIDRSLNDDARDGRPPLSDAQRMMIDPAWAAIDDLDHLKALWRETYPGKRVPLESLTDIVVAYRDVDRATVVSRRSRPKSRRIGKKQRP